MWLRRSCRQTRLIGGRLEAQERTASEGGPYKARIPGQELADVGLGDDANLIDKAELGQEEKGTVKLGGKLVEEWRKGKMWWVRGEKRP